MNDDLFYLNRFTSTDIVVDESDNGAVEKLNFSCNSSQAKTYYNNLLNSNFGSDFEKWSLKSQDQHTASIDTSVYLSSNKSFKIVYGSGGYAIYYQLIKFINTHKYYIKGNSRNTNEAMNSLGIRIYASDTQKYTVNITKVGINIWKSSSYIYIADGTETDLDLVSSMTAGQTGTVWFDDIQLIDLTAQFGAGNEPTLAWCDANITYDKCWAIDIPNTIYSSGDGGKIQVWSHKKNMFDKNAVTSGKYISSNGNIANYYAYSLSDYIPINSNTRYSYQGISEYSERGAFYDANKQLISTFVESTIAANQYINTPSNAKYVRFTIINTNQDINNFQLELGSTATTSESYTGSIVDITTPVGYIGGSLPNGVADTDTQKKIGKVVLNGSESWSIASTLTNTIVFQLYPVSTMNSTSGNVLCDKFKYTATSDVEKVNASGTTLYIGILKSRLAANTVAAFKTWLTSNNVTVYYELVTPVDITITKSLVNTYEGANTITTTNNVKPSLTIEAWKK